MRLTFICLLLETWSLYMLVDAAEIPAIKRNSSQTNTISKSKDNYDHKTPPEPGKYQSKTYEKTLIFTVPDCYEFQEETEEEYMVRYMCEMDTMIHDFQKSQENVDPTWLYWNSQNPMSHEPVHCQNVAFRREKWNACYQFDLRFDEYDHAVQEIIEKYLQMSLEVLNTVQISDFLLELENEYNCPTLGLETEIMELLLDNLYYYISRTENISRRPLDENYNVEKVETEEDDGAHSYYYYFYYDE